MPKPKRLPSTKKKPAASASDAKPADNRRLPQPKRLWYNPFTWRSYEPLPVYVPLPKARILFWRTLQQLWRGRVLFGGLVLAFGVLNILLVRGLAGSSDLVDFKDLISGLAHGFSGAVATSFGTFMYLLATSGSGNARNSAAYQYLLLLICSLAFIWAFRQHIAKRNPRVRDGFYLGMSPLIPYMLILLVIGLQLTPMVAGSSIYGLIVSNGIAVHWYEKALFIGVFVVLALWSLRMITGSIFASYITTLPGMTPVHAIKSANRLVRGRRLQIWRKLIFLPILLIVIAVAIEVPLIMVFTPAAPWVFFILTMLALPVVHGYLYNLYRELL